MTCSSQRWLSGIIAAVLVVSATGVGNAQQLLFDDFSGSGIVDPTVWRLPFGSEGTFVGQTQFRGDSAVDMPLQGIAEPLASDGFVTEIHLDTFSPLDPGNQFLGTDLLTKRDFAVGGGLTFESRMRLDPAAVGAGIVNGFFTFDTHGDNTIRDEIDFELLGNQAVGDNDIFLNVFDDAPFTGPGSGGTPTLNNVAALDLTAFNDYKIEWTPQSVKWFINDNLVRTDTTNVPDDPQKLHFNIWAPDSGFVQAFDAGLQATAVEANNQRFTSQVDWVEVNRINTDVSANLLTDGSFETTVPLLNQPIGTVTDTWYSFNQASVVFGGADGAPAADDGLFLGKTFGPFLGSTNASGFQQQVAASPGEEFEVSAAAFTPASGVDALDGTNNFATVGISFVDASGNVLEIAPFVPLDGSDFPLLDGRDPNLTSDVYVEGTASGLAPAGTAFARVTVLFLQLIDGNGGPDGGAVFFDDVSLVRLTALAPPIGDGDYNESGLVSAADYAVYRAGASPNGLVQGDYDAWATNFGTAGAAIAATAAVPEPSGLLLAFTAAAFVGRRRR